MKLLTMNFLFLQINLEIIFIMWKYMNFWKRVVSYNFDVLKLIIKPFWIWVEFFIIESLTTVLFIVKHDLSVFLPSYLQNIFCIWMYKNTWKGMITHNSDVLNFNMNFWCLMVDQKFININTNRNLLSIVEQPSFSVSENYLVFYFFQMNAFQKKDKMVSYNIDLTSAPKHFSTPPPSGDISGPRSFFPTSSSWPSPQWPHVSYSGHPHQGLPQ